MADAEKIVPLLLRKYPNPGIALNFSNPLELLIATILSAQCTDARVNEVTKSLFKKYRSAKDYAGANLKIFEGEIKSTGFYKNKAKTVIECCRKITKDFGGKVPGTLEELTTLPGVGRKTANMVLGSAFDRQTMAVDTHVFRVSNRLGIARSNNPDKVEEDLVGQLPEEKLTAFNLALILHGRETCTAKKPKCPECVLYDECEWPEKAARGLRGGGFLGEGNGKVQKIEMRMRTVEFLKNNDDLVSGEKFSEEVCAVFKGEIIGKEIIFYESTTSTNDLAMEIGEQRADPEGIVVIADTQSRGKGRLGRSWISPPGVNLYFTVLLGPPILPKESSILTLMAAVAVVSAIREYAGLDAKIKWPNDILINNKKVGGILIEMKSDMDRINLVALGIGLNVNMPLNMLTKDIRPFTTSLKRESGKSIDRVKLLGRVLAELEYSYKILLNGNKGALINEWLRLDSTIGNNVKVQMHDRVISGIAEGIDDDGQLMIMLASGALEKVSAGEVTILKNVSADFTD